MADWTAFAATVAVLTLLLLCLTRRSRRTLTEVTVVDDRETLASDVADVADVENGTADTADAGPTANDDPAANGDPAANVDPTADADSTAGRFLTTRLLLVNVVVSQALFLGALVGIAWWAGVPASVFGLSSASLSASAVALGVGVGMLLAAGNAAAARLGEEFGVAAPTALRSALAPSDRGEWVLLLGVLLPTVAVFEELLFRGALVGALSAGFGVDPWLLAVGSSVVFGLGHGAQGRVGVAVTATLGAVLASAFVVTDSLLVVVVAHYVVNAAEFLERESLPGALATR